VLRPGERLATSVTWDGHGNVGHMFSHIMVWCANNHTANSSPRSRVRATQQTRAEDRDGGSDGADGAASAAEDKNCTARFKFRVEATLQPALSFPIRQLDLGVIPLASTRVKPVWFRNHGVVAVSWKAWLRRRRSESDVSSTSSSDSDESDHNTSGDDVMDSDGDCHDDVCTAFPTHGVLQASTTQMLNITFRPSVDDRDTPVVYDLFVRSIESGAVTMTTVQAVSGTSSLRLLEPRDADGALVSFDELRRLPLANPQQWLDKHKRITMGACTHATSMDVDFGCVHGWDAMRCCVGLLSLTARHCSLGCNSCIKVRTCATMKVVLHNTGMLAASFHIANIDTFPEWFSVEPVNGTVKGRGMTVVAISFTPVGPDECVRVWMRGGLCRAPPTSGACRASVSSLTGGRERT